VTRFWRGSLVVAAIEGALVGAIYLAPGAGHSPLWYSQLPALIIVGVLNPHAGTCFACAPLAWSAGILSQTVLMVALWALIVRLFHVRDHAHL
jgi:hypothetical protein